MSIKLKARPVKCYDIHISGMTDTQAKAFDMFIPVIEGEYLLRCVPAVNCEKGEYWVLRVTEDGKRDIELWIEHQQ